MNQSFLQLLSAILAANVPATSRRSQTIQPTQTIHVRNRPPAGWREEARHRKWKRLAKRQRSNRRAA